MELSEARAFILHQRLTAPQVGVSFFLLSTPRLFAFLSRDASTTHDEVDGRRMAVHVPPPPPSLRSTVSSLFSSLYTVEGGEYLAKCSRG